MNEEMLFVAIGVLLMFGTAGASDCGLIGEAQILIQSAISLGLIACGVWLRARRHG